VNAARPLAWLVVLVAAAAPWAFGATEPGWAALLAVGCLVPVTAALIVDAVRAGPPGPDGARAERLGWLVVSIPLVAALGLIPLPGAVRAVLAPSGAALLGDLDPGAAATWRPTSLAPHATLGALGLAAAYVGAFLLLRRESAAPRGRGILTIALVASGAGLALVGLLQHFTQAGALQPKIYWTYEVYEAGTPFGPYVNRNHFAGAMVLLGSVASGEFLAAVAERRRGPAVAWGSAMMTMLFALAATTSRGGLLAAASGAAFLVLTLPAGRRLRGAVVVCGVAAGVVALLAWAGALDALLGRAFHLYGRWMHRFGVQRDAIAAFLGNPVLGTGAGTFEDVYPAYQRVADDRSFQNAHSDWAQILMETGLAGAVVCVLTARRFAGWVRRGTGARDGRRWRVLGPAAGVVGIAVHGFFEVNLHVPANALLTVCALSLACAAAADPEAGAPVAASGSAAGPTPGED
jgi:O-antigen ligase